MRAVVWHGRRDVRIETVPDPVIQEPTDAVIRVTSSGLCGSDLHLYEVMAPFMAPGDVLGHEPMGIVEAVGPDITGLQVGDRVVVPFNIACGHCFMCDRGLQSQCETTQVHEHGCGAALFGYTKLYGQVPGGQAELLRVPHADYGPIKVPAGPGDDRFLFLSDGFNVDYQCSRLPHFISHRAFLYQRHIPAIGSSVRTEWTAHPATRHLCFSTVVANRPAFD